MSVTFYVNELNASAAIVKITIKYSTIVRNVHEPRSQATSGRFFLRKGAVSLPGGHVKDANRVTRSAAHLTKSESPGEDLESVSSPSSSLPLRFRIKFLSHRPRSSRDGEGVGLVPSRALKTY